MPFRPSLWPTLFTAVGLVILASLGTWQLRRHQEAQAFRADWAERRAAAPLDADDLDRPAADLSWHDATLTGTWSDDGPWYVAGRVAFGRPGYDLVDVLEVDGGPRLLVNRGWVPADRWAEVVEDAAEEGTVTVSGLLLAWDRAIRAPQRPAEGDKPARFQQAIGSWLGVFPRRMGVPYASIADEAGDVAPVLLVVGPERAPGRDLAPGTLPASGYVAAPKQIGHFAYAMQWYLIGLTLLGVWTYAGWRRGVALQQDASA